MLLNKKTVLLLGLVAAYGAYKYSKLSPGEKNDLKQKGRKLVEEHLPDDLKSLFGLQPNGKADEANSQFF